MSREQALHLIAPVISHNTRERKDRLQTELQAILHHQRTHQIDQEVHARHPLMLQAKTLFKTHYENWKGHGFSHAIPLTHAQQSPCSS